MTAAALLGVDIMDLYPAPGTPTPSETATGVTRPLLHYVGSQVRVLAVA